MTCRPKFTVTSGLLQRIEQIAVLREKILAATLQVAWIPKLQQDARARNAHSSTAIEGNPLTLEQVRALEEGRALSSVEQRSKREVLNYFAALRFVEKNVAVKQITHEEISRLHRIIAEGGMDQGKAGQYRKIQVRVGRHMPPAPEDVFGLMGGLLDWWNEEASKWSPVVSSAVIHYQFEDIHPFADGNGRAGRMLALWELYRRGFDTHHIFAVDEYYWEDRPRYYAALDAVRQHNNDLTGWLEYCAEGLERTLNDAWLRIQRLASEPGSEKIVLRPNQEKLLNLLRSRTSMTPSEIWEELGVTRQGAMHILRPLIKANLIRKIGSKRNGKYVLMSQRSRTKVS